MISFLGSKIIRFHNDQINELKLIENIKADLPTLPSDNEIQDKIIMYNTVI